MSELTQKHCVPCEGGAKPLTQDEAREHIREIPGWILSDDARHMSREFKFTDFMRAMEFVRQIADIAEIEDHHPDIHIFYNRVKLELTTHAIKGLSLNDFIVAAKINALPL